MAPQGATSFAQIGQRLELRAPSTSQEDVQNRAAVAMVLRERNDDLELLFIRRAELEDDHWSGDIAFPGGRVEARDAGAREAAERETAEEVGLAIGPANGLGRLDDLRGRSGSIVVSGFVYGMRDDRPLVPNHEVREAFWMPLPELLDPARFVTRTFQHGHEELELPAIRLLDEPAPVLWGLSYRFLDLFMTLIGRAIPSMPWRSDL